MDADGFRRRISSSGTPVSSAIDDGVSPGWTVYRRGPLRSRRRSSSPPPLGVLWTTLFGLARRYYGDGARFVDLYLANREAVPTPDQLTPGTVLVIPDLPGTPAPAPEAPPEEPPGTTAGP